MKQEKLEFSILETLAVRDELCAAKEELKNVKAEVRGLKEVIATQHDISKDNSDVLRKTKQALDRKTDIEKRLRIENTSLKQQVRLRKGIKKDPLEPGRQLKNERIKLAARERNLLGGKRDSCFSEGDFGFEE